LSALSIRVRWWSIVCAVLGAGLMAVGLRLRADATLPFYERPAVTIILGSAAALLLLVALVLVIRTRVRPGARAEQEAESSLAGARPYATLFLISFVALFVELMLIRYCGSQVRIFSFYKNVPLIACFLGLGLGCWLACGTGRNAMLFLLWLVPLGVFLSAGSLGISNALGKLAATGSSEQILGDFLPEQPSTAWRLAAQASIAAFCVATLSAITLLFVQLGRLLGAAFERVERLPGYTVNIVGSLAGILTFVALGYLRTPPWVWFVVGLVPLLWWIPGRGGKWAALALALVNVVAVAPNYGDTVWSPYQKLVGHKVPVRSETGVPTSGYLVQISDVFYQLAVDRRPETLARTGSDPMGHYDAVWSRLPRPSNVLVVGAGTGNDVAAALRARADHVDAVDIDPTIVEMGRLHHPEQPYSNPRVRVIVDDARHAFRVLPRSTYDAVVFGLLDSHTQLGMSSVRLDNYVFTRESFAEARRLINPGGHLVVTAASASDWFRERFEAMLGETVGGQVSVLRHDEWFTFIARVEDGPGAALAVSDSAVVEIPTDDWPFLYLPTRGVPAAYLWVVACLVATSLLLLRLHGLRVRALGPFEAHMFFLGAAFLLMEVHAINRLALLFGTTWLVSAVTIAIVLALIVLANVTVLVARGVPYVVSYSLLVASLAASWWLDPASVLGATVGAKLAFGLALLSPVYFAGLVFARSFSGAELATTAMGANIMGAVLGGWVEYATMAWGIRALVLLAALFYLLSLASLAVGRKSRLGAPNMTPVSH
jgi:SAM-dependent methyltransferase